MPNICPPRDDLARFSAGYLDDSPAEEIATHVDSCADCRTVLEELSSTSDSLADALREPGELPYAGESALAAALPRLQAIRVEHSSAAELMSDNSPRPAAVPFSPPQSIRDYEILESLGQGGMGAVYKARHRHLKKIVALKVLRLDRMLGADAIARFEREMEAVGKLEHPNLVRAMDAGESEGTHFLVMEYVGGPDLSRLLKQHGPLRIADACELIRQAAVGLQHVHEQGMVHRDIKPSNLMLGPNGTVKILDLGLALLADDGSATGRELTTAGKMIGTLDYMAPEQGDDTHHVDIRADIYSLGATLYALLTGVAPFGDPKFRLPVMKLMALATQEPEPVQHRRSDVPPALAAIVTKMLAKSPDQRYASPAEVAEALAPFASNDNLPGLSDQGLRTTAPVKTGADDTCPSLKSFSVDTLPPSPRPASVAELKHRNSQLRWLGIGGLAAIIVAAIVFFIQTPQGTVKVTINDPSISVKFDSKGAVIEGADPKPIQLKFGQQGIVIQRGDFEFTTTSFRLQKKGETTLDIELLPTELKVVYDGELIHRKPLTPPVAPSLPPATPAAVAAHVALEFDGQTTHVLVPTLQPETDKPLTIEALVNASSELKTASVIASAFSPMSSLSLVRGDRGGPAFLVRRDLASVASTFVSDIKASHWLHVAGVWDGKTTKLFLQGKPFFVTKPIVTPGGTEALDQHFTIGAQFSSKGLLPSAFFQGQLDEIRLSKIARYEKEFKPLQIGERFTPDQHTLALYHCDDARGDVLLDSSANKHHGQIVGAKWASADPK